MSTPRRRRLRPGLCCLTLLFSLSLGCAEEPAPPTPLAPVPTVSDLDALDVPVRQQYLERRESLELLQGSPGIEPHRLATAYGELGMWFHAYGDHEAALTCYRNALLLAADDPRWTYYLADGLSQLGRLEEAAASYRRFLELWPESVPARLRLADLELERDQRREARRLLEEALDRDPASAAAHYRLGQLAQREGRPEEAIERLSEAAGLDEAPAIRYALGLAYREAGDLERAREHLERARDGSAPPEFPDLLLAPVLNLRSSATMQDRRARAAYEAGRPEEALAAAREAVAAAPDNPLYRLNLGAARLAVGRPQEAIEAFEQALELQPDYPAGHFNLGVALAQLGESAAAADAYRRALTLDPQYKEAHYNLATLLRHAGDFAAAASHYERAATLDPALARARYWQAWCVLQQGRRQEAVELLEGALRDFPGDGDLLSLHRQLTG